jgi:DMSO reductase anchor subunit
MRVKPAFSVLIFTVLSGAGLGALALLCASDLAAALGVLAMPIPPGLMAIASAFALAFVITGLSTSTLHLANPKNAWRSAARWRSSWLSREAILALVLVPAAFGYALAWQLKAGPALRLSLALCTLLAAWGTLHCTAMIYASLKPIRQWHTWRVPVNYLLLGHASGALLIAAIVRGAGHPADAVNPIACALLIGAAAAKVEYWRYIASEAGVTTIERAIGVANGVHGTRVPDGTPVPGRGAPPSSVMAARLFDSGHARGTFLTKEFLFTVTARRRRRAQWVVWIGGFALPLAWLGFGPPRWPGAVLAMAACIIGLLAERWLFFADARHTVRLFHGDART